MDGTKSEKSDATLVMLLQGTKTQQFDNAFHYLDGKYREQVHWLKVAIVVLLVGWVFTSICLVVLMVGNDNRHIQYEAGNYEWSLSVQRAMTDLQNENARMRSENQAAWKSYGDWIMKVQDDGYFREQELSKSTNVAASTNTIATPAPTKPAPAVNPEIQKWCTSGEAKWLPESGNPTSAYVRHVTGIDQLTKVTVIGPEVAFDAVIAPGADLNGLDAAVNKISENGYASYSIVCGSFNPYQYELKAIKFNGVQVWPVVAEPKKVDTTQTQTVVSPPQDTHLTTETPKVLYWEVSPRGWEVNFSTKYVEDIAGRQYVHEGDPMYDPYYPGSYYPGTFFQAATCNGNDLQAIKDVLINDALRGNSVTFEYVSRWGKDFLTGITKGLDKETEWRVCPEWFTANGAF